MSGSSLSDGRDDHLTRDAGVVPESLTINIPVSPRDSLSSVDLESPRSRPVTPTSPVNVDGDEVFQYSSRPRTPRERQAALTVSFQLINHDTLSTDIYNIPVFENTILAEVGRTLLKKFGKNSDLVFLSGDEEVPFNSELKVVKILPKLPIDDVKLLNPTFRFSGIHYAKLHVVKDLCREKAVCAGVIYCCSKGFSKSITTSEGFSFILFNHLGIQCGSSSQLHEAAAYGKINVVEDYLHSIPPDVSVELLQDYRKATPLHYSAQNGHLEVCGKIVETFGAHILDCLDLNGRTALHVALYWKRYDVVSYLLQFKQSYTHKQLDKVGYSCLDLFKGLKEEARKKILHELDAESLEKSFQKFSLHQAVLLGSCELTRKFCMKLTPEELTFKVPKSCGRSILHVAAAKCDLGIVRLLIEAGCDVGAMDDMGWLPLHYACADGNVVVLPSLLRGGLKSDCLNHALHLSLHKRHKDIVRIIIQACPDIQLTDEVKHMIWDCIKNLDECDKEIVTNLRRDATIHDRLLLEICRDESQVDLLKTLIDKSLVKVSCQDFMGRTALHESCQSVNVKAVALLLLCSDVDVNAVDWRYSTPLHYACIKGNTEVVSALLQHPKIAVNAVNVLGKTPVLEALYHGQVDVALLTLSWLDDAGLGQCDIYGRNVLSFTHLFNKTITDELVAKNIALKPFSGKSHSSSEFDTGALSLWRPPSEKFPLSYTFHYLNQYRVDKKKFTCPGCKLEVPYAKAKFWLRYHVCTGDNLPPVSSDTVSSVSQACETFEDIALTNACSTAVRWLFNRQQEEPVVEQRQRRQPRLGPPFKNNRTSDVVSPLHSVVQNGSPKFIKLLCCREEYLRMEDEHGRNCLELAIDMLKPAMVKAILAQTKHNAVFSKLTEGVVLRSLKGHAWSYTEQEKRYKIFVHLVDAGCDVNEERETQPCRCVRNKPHDTHLCCCRYETAVSVAVRSNLMKCLDKLLEAGAVIDNTKKMCALHEGIRAGRVEMLEKLMGKVIPTLCANTAECKILVDIACLSPHKGLALFKLLVAKFPCILSEKEVDNPLVSVTKSSEYLHARCLQQITSVDNEDKGESSVVSAVENSTDPVDATCPRQVTTEGDDKENTVLSNCESSTQSDIIKMQQNTILEKVLLSGPMVSNRTDRVCLMSDTVRDIAVYLIQSECHLGEVFLGGPHKCTVHAGCAALLAAVKKQQWNVVGELFKRKVAHQFWECCASIGGKLSISSSSCQCSVRIGADVREILRMMVRGSAPQELVMELLLSATKLSRSTICSEKADNDMHSVKFDGAECELQLSKADFPNWQRFIFVANIIEDCYKMSPLIAASNPSSIGALTALFKFYIGIPVVTEAMLNILENIKATVVFLSRKTKEPTQEAVYFVTTSFHIAHTSMAAKRPLFHEACKDDHVVLVKHLQVLYGEVGLKFEVPGVEDPLELAALYGNAEVIQVLLASCSLSTEAKHNALSACCGFAIANTYVRDHDNSSERSDRKWLRKLRCRRYKDYIAKKYDEREKIVQMLVTTCKDIINDYHNFYGPPLFGACCSGMTSVVKNLLKHGAQPLVSFKNKCAMEVAMKEGHFETASVVLEECRDKAVIMPGVVFHALLLQAASSKMWTIVDLLLSHFASQDINLSDPTLKEHDKSITTGNDGKNALHHLVISGQRDLITKFLSLCPPLALMLSGQPDNRRRSALWYACAYEHWDIASSLIYFSGQKLYFDYDLTARRQYSIVYKELLGLSARRKYQQSVILFESCGIGENSPEAVQRENSPETVQNENSSNAVHSGNAPEGVQTDNFLKAIHRENSPEAVQSEPPGGTVGMQGIVRNKSGPVFYCFMDVPVREKHTDIFGNIQQFSGSNQKRLHENSPEAVQSENSPDAVQNENSSNAVHSENSAVAVQTDKCSEAIHHENSPEAVQSEPPGGAVGMQGIVRNKSEPVFYWFMDVLAREKHTDIFGNVQRFPGSNQKRLHENSPKKAVHSEKLPEAVQSRNLPEAVHDKNSPRAVQTEPPGRAIAIHGIVRNKTKPVFYCLRHAPPREKHSDIFGNIQRFSESNQKRRLREIPEKLTAHQKIDVFGKIVNFEQKSGQMPGSCELMKNVRTLLAYIQTAGVPMLHKACAAGDIAIVTALLKHHPEWRDLLDTGNRSPLFYALYNGRLDIAALLIDKNCNIMVGSSPLEAILFYCCKLKCASYQHCSSLKSIYCKYLPRHQPSKERHFVHETLNKYWLQHEPCCSCGFCDHTRISDYRSHIENEVLPLFQHVMKARAVEDCCPDFLLSSMSFLSNKAILKAFVDFGGEINDKEDLSVIGCILELSPSGNLLSPQHHRLAEDAEDCAGLIAGIQNNLPLDKLLPVATEKMLWNILSAFAHSSNARDAYLKHLWCAVLNQASFHGKTALVSQLLPLFSSENNDDKVQLTLALHCAAHKQHADVVNLLLRFAVQVDCSFTQEECDALKYREYPSPGWSSLHWAAVGGCYQILEMLLASCSNTIDELTHIELLFIAAAYGHETIVKNLLTEDLSITPRMPSRFNKRIDTRSVILTCAKNGHFQLCVYLVENFGCDLSEVTAGQNLYHYASRRGCDWFIDFLLSSNIQGYGTVDEYGYAPVIYAQVMGHISLTQVILDYCKSQEEEQVLFREDGIPLSIGWFKTLMAVNKDAPCNSNVGISQNSNYSLKDQPVDGISYALMHGEDMVAYMMIQASRNLEFNFFIALENGATMLHYAAKGGAVNSLRELLDILTTSQAYDALINLNFHDNKGYSALAYAVEYGHVDCIDLLTSFNTDLYWENPKSKENLLHLAVRSKHKHVAEAVLSACDQSLLIMGDSFGIVPYGYACALGRANEFSELLVNCVDKEAHQDHLSCGTVDYTCLQCLFSCGFGWSRYITSPDMIQQGMLSGLSCMETTLKFHRDKIKWICNLMKSCQGNKSLLKAFLRLSGFDEDVFQATCCLKQTMGFAHVTHLNEKAVRVLFNGNQREGGCEVLIRTLCLQPLALSVESLMQFEKEFPSEMAWVYESMATQREQYLYSSAEIAIAMGQYTAFSFLADRSANAISEEFDANIASSLPLKSQWMLGKRRVQDELWMETVARVWCPTDRLNDADVWLAANWPSSVLPVLQKYNRHHFKETTIHLPGVAIECDYDSFSRNAVRHGIAEFTLRALLNSSIIVSQVLSIKCIIDTYSNMWDKTTHFVKCVDAECWSETSVGSSALLPFAVSPRYNGCVQVIASDVTDTKAETRARRQRLLDHLKASVQALENQVNEELGLDVDIDLEVHSSLHTCDLVDLEKVVDETSSSFLGGLDKTLKDCIEIYSIIHSYTDKQDLARITNSLKVLETITLSFMSCSEDVYDSDASRVFGIGDQAFHWKCNVSGQNPSYQFSFPWWRILRLEMLSMICLSRPSGLSVVVDWETFVDIEGHMELERIVAISLPYVVNQVSVVYKSNVHITTMFRSLRIACCSEESDMVISRGVNDGEINLKLIIGGMVGGKRSMKFPKIVKFFHNVLYEDLMNSDKLPMLKMTLKESLGKHIGHVKTFLAGGSIKLSYVWHSLDALLKKLCETDEHFSDPFDVIKNIWVNVFCPSVLQHYRSVVGDFIHDTESLLQGVPRCSFENEQIFWWNCHKLASTDFVVGMGVWKPCVLHNVDLASKVLFWLNSSVMTPDGLGADGCHKIDMCWTPRGYYICHNRKESMAKRQVGKHIKPCRKGSASGARKFSVETKKSICTAGCCYHRQLIAVSAAELSEHMQETPGMQPEFLSYEGMLFTIGGQAEIKKLLNVIPQSLTISFSTSADLTDEFCIENFIKHSLAWAKSQRVKVDHEFPVTLMPAYSNVIIQPFPVRFRMDVGDFYRKLESDEGAESQVLDIQDRVLASLYAAAHWEDKATKTRTKSVPCQQTAFTKQTFSQGKSKNLVCQYIHHVHVKSTKPFAGSSEDVICKRQGSSAEPFDLMLSSEGTLDVIVTAPLEDGNLCLSKRTLNKTMFGLMKQIRCHSMRLLVRSVIIEPLCEGLSRILKKTIPEEMIILQHHLQKGKIVTFVNMTMQMLETFLLCKVYIVDDVLDALQFICDNVPQLAAKLVDKFELYHIGMFSTKSDVKPSLTLKNGHLRYVWPFEDMISAPFPVFVRSPQIIHHLVSKKLKIPNDKVDSLQNTVCLSYCRLIKKESYKLFYPDDFQKISLSVALCNVYQDIISCAQVNCSDVTVELLHVINKGILGIIGVQSFAVNKGVLKLVIKVDTFQDASVQDSLVVIKLHGVSISGSPFYVGKTWSHMLRQGASSGPQAGMSPRTSVLEVVAGKEFPLILEHKQMPHLSFEKIAEQCQNVSQTHFKHMVERKRKQSERGVGRTYQLFDCGHRVALFHKHLTEGDGIIFKSGIVSAGKNSSMLKLRPGKAGETRFLVKCKCCQDFLSIMSPVGFSPPSQPVRLKTLVGELHPYSCVLLDLDSMDGGRILTKPKMSLTFTATENAQFGVQLFDIAGNVIPSNQLKALPTFSLLDGCSEDQDKVKVTIHNSGLGILLVSTSLLTKAGTHYLKINHHHTSQNVIVVAGPLCPVKCHVHGRGTSVATSNFQTTFRLSLCDAFKNVLEVKKSHLKMIRADISGSPCTVRLPADGSKCFNISYRLNIVGKVQLEVQVDGIPIEGSPFTIDIQQTSQFEERLKNFRAQLQQQRTPYETIWLRLSRKHVFDQSFHEFENLGRNDLTSRLEIHFQGEDGIDCGGLTREWYQLLSQEIFNPDYAMFVRTEDGTYAPNKNSDVHEDYLRMFAFVGKVFAKAVFDGESLDVHFTPSMYKNLLDIPMDSEDLKAVEPTIHWNLQQLSEYETAEEVESLCLNFAVNDEKFGEMREVPLKKGGAEIDVTLDNRDDYVQLYTKYLLTDCLEKQIKEFKKGFTTLIPMSSLKDFTEKELELIICGPDEIDVDILKKHAQYVHFKQDSNETKWLWEVLQESNQDLRASFLQFTTGMRRMPVYRRNWNIKIVKSDSQNDSHLPISHTCFNEFVMPAYSTKEILQIRLKTALEYGRVGFSFA